MNINPTQIANYVRLQCCDRYLWNLKKTSKEDNQEDIKIGSKKKHIFNASEGIQKIDPYLSKSGGDHELEFENYLIKDLSMKKNETFDALKKAKENGFCREIEISGKIVDVEVKGRIDFLLHIEKNFHIVECKASMEDKTYQRLQAAVYAILIDQHNSARDIPTSALVIRKNAYGELQTLTINGSKLIINSETKKNDNLSRPSIDGEELVALKADIKMICNKFCDLQNETAPDFQLIPRCHDCDFNAKCLSDAKENANAEGNAFGYQILGYGAKGSMLKDCKTMEDIKKKKNIFLFPPPDKLVEVRQAYYLASNSAEVAKHDGTVPHLPAPDRKQTATTETHKPFLQFFLCIEGDMTNMGKLGAISLHTVKYTHAPEDSLAESSHCWTKWKDSQNTHTEHEILTALANQINTEINGNLEFYAHFYFWSIEEKKLLAQACQRVIKGNELGDDCLIKRLLHWISRHEYLREPLKEKGKYKININGLPTWPPEHTNQEEGVCTQVSQEVRRCFALGSLGQTLLEVSCLKWDYKNEPKTWASEWCPNIVDIILGGILEDVDKSFEPACNLSNSESIRKKLREKMIFNDTLPPSVWWNDRDTRYPTKEAIECYFKKRVRILAELEQYIRCTTYSNHKYFYTITEEKVCNTEYPDCNNEDLVKGARNMLLIETMHHKDRWLKEVTDRFEEMKVKYRAIELVSCPKWHVKGEFIEIIAYIPLGLNNSDRTEKDRICAAFDAKREELKLTGATRILQTIDGKKPDKLILEEGSISCRAPKWRFSKESIANHYLNNNKLLKLCNSNMFFIYDEDKDAVLVRLTPVKRIVDLTVQSAWRNDKEPYIQSETINSPSDDGQVFKTVEDKKALAWWLVTDFDVYKEASILSGLEALPEPEILKILTQ